MSNGNTLSGHKFAGVELTSASIRAAADYFIRLSLECIRDAETFKHPVNDLNEYRREQLAIMYELAENPRISFTLLQRAHFIQTGEEVALLT
jgi:hypothetical protein